MSALLFGGMLVAASTFALWVYERRELPIPGRRRLATLRALTLALIVALLWNPTVPFLGRSAGVPARWTLVDGSLSMGALGPDGASAWEKALARVQRTGEADEPVMVFGAELWVAPDTLPSLPPGAPASRLAPALERVAESGSREVTVLSDLRLSDARAASAALARLGLRAEFVRLGGVRKNAAVPIAGLPRVIDAGDSVVADVAVRSAGTTAGDSVLVEVREEGALRASRSVAVPAEGRLARIRLVLPPPSHSGLVRYEVRATLSGDGFPDDDARARYVEVDPEAGGLVLISLSPDWEPRFLMPVLEQITGLPGHGYLRLTNGRFMPLRVAGASAGVVDEEEARARAEGAELLVVHGVGAGLPGWLGDALATARRSIAFVEDVAGAQATDVAVGGALPGEWYAAPDLPPSPLASSLVGVPWTDLPPLTGVLPLNRMRPGRVPLELQLLGSGPSEAAMVLQSAQGHRQAVVLASGFWRWGFRDGPPREAYRRLWAGVVDWMLANEPLGAGPGVAPADRIVDRGAPVVWRADAWAGERLRVRLTSGEDPVSDSVLTVGPTGVMRTGELPPGPYAFRVEEEDEGRVVGEGRFEVERYTDELLTPVFDPPAQPAAAGRASVGDPPGPPLRTLALPYLLLIALLSGEWIGRRRGGLR